MQQVFARKRSLSKKRADKGQLKITFNDVYDISCTDVYQNKTFRLSNDNKSVKVGETLEDDVYNELQYIKLKYKIISEEEITNAPAQRTMTIHQQESNNNSFVEGNVKKKRYEFEINLKQMFEQCKLNKGYLMYQDQLPYYEQLQQQAQQQQKKDPQGYANLTFSLTIKTKQDRQAAQ